MSITNINYLFSLSEDAPGRTSQQKNRTKPTTKNGRLLPKPVSFTSITNQKGWSVMAHWSCLRHTTDRPGGRFSRL